MLKKFVISLLLVMIIACGMGISSTIAYAADGEVTEETNIAVNYKVASYKIDGSYTANTPIEFKDGDAVVGALKIDKTPDKAGFGVKLVSGSTFSFVPNANYKVTKLIYALTSTNYVNFNTPDAKYGTKFDDLTDADVELLRQVGINANKSDSFGAELNVNHTATEEDPYKFKIGNALEFGTICVVYEKLPITETIYPVVSHSNKWLNAGDIQVDIKNTGYGDSSSGTTINNSSQIIIKSTPGYIITSVVLKSPSADKMLKLSYLTGAEDLSVVNEELSFTITGFEAGQDYTFGNKSDFYWYVKEITITYEEHVHAPEGLTPNYDDTKHWDDCICGAVVNAEAHGFVEGEITKQPGNGLPGEQLQTCQVCSAEVIKYLPCPITDSAITVELANQLACNGTEQAQKVSIKVGDVVLEEGVDYTLSNNLQTNAGDYTLTITGIGKYSGERTLGFTIEKGIIARPMSDSSFPEYDGTAQNFWIKPDNTRYTISGNRQTEVGTYVAEVTLTEEAYANYRWEETTEPTITYEFEITKGKVNLPSTRTTTFTYNGQEQTYYISTNSRYTISGDSRTQTNAGTYTITVSLNDPDNYQWKNGTEGNLTYLFVINKINVPMPVADPTVFTYNGQAQTYALQENNLYTISGTTFTNAGNHTITVSLVDKTNYQWESGNSNDLEYSFVIGKATYDISGVVFADKVVDYDGNAYSLEVKNLPSGVTVAYENNAQTNAGEYTITAKFTGDADNYNLIENKTATLIINKLNVEKPTADSGVYTYNGEEQTYALQASDLYNILDNKGTNAGNYTVKVVLKDKTNYQWESGNSNDLEYSFVIGKATYDMSGVVFANKTVTYNGSAFSIEATNLPIGVTVAYENNGKTDAGEYTITAIFTGNANYNAIANKTATLTINKATYDMSGVVFANKTVTYNGNAFSIDATNLPTGVTASYENNGKTEAGVYTIIAKFTGNGNYNEIPNKTATLTINKAVVTAPTADTTVFTYNGQAQTYALQANNLYTISTATYTNAGAYPITVELNDKANYEWADGTIADLTFSFVIGKATYDMSGVVFEDKTVVYNGNEFTIVATNIPTGVSVTYENNVGTTAGVYTAIAKFTGDADNYELIANKTAVLTINKATYDMSAVVFEDKTVVYNGNEFSIVATNLPNGVSATYENNGKTNAGTYTITAMFTGDATNYELIANKTATLTIKKASFTFDIDSENDATEDIIITSDGGIDPNKELVVKVVESEKSSVEYKEFISKNEKVAFVYDIKLIQDNVSVQPDGTLKFKVIIPTELVGKSFSIIHIHNGNEKSIIDYTIDGDYVVFESDKLSEFVFVYEMGSLLWVIIVLGVIALLEIAFLLYLYMKNKQFKNKKLASVYPPFIFGMFIPEAQLVLVIVLAVLVIALAVVAILFALKVINGKTKVLVANNGTALGESEEELAITEDDKEEKFNINSKSFTEKLSQSSSEVIKYYNEIRNELLSYKKVKSKISYKHESFRLGMSIVAKLKIRGKSLYLFLALDPNDYKESKYKIKDMSNVKANKDVPTMYKINLPRRAVYAKELIADLMKKYGVEKSN